ncbi:MAG TPA: GFA family protein [Microvirga sp.]|nr:GFA family protein [Microvirga sp.]
MPGLSGEGTRTGGCACGAVRFTARGEPRRVGLCHCMTCRQASGSIFNAFAVYSRDAVELAGETGAWASSTRGRRHFCPRCGSQVFARNEGSDEIEMRLGAFDEPNLFRPTYEAWIGRRESWFRTDAPLHGYARNRTERGPAEDGG